MRTGFIGLGNIGILIARDLAASGNELTVYDVMPAGPDEVRQKGAKVAASPAEVARNADIIGICVRDTKEIRDVMEGSNGILSAARPGLLVAIHSTISVEDIRDIAAKAKAKGVDVVDAPVSRGVTSPASKGIVFMVGGTPENVARVEPFVALAALKIVKTGALGTGMALKICNNLLTYSTMVMANDAARLALSSGLDVKLLADVTSNNGVAGPTLTHLFMQRAGASNTNIVPPSVDSLIGLGEKDLDCALEVGKGFGLDLPAVKSSRAAFRQTVHDQWGIKK